MKTKKTLYNLWLLPEEERALKTLDSLPSLEITILQEALKRGDLKKK